jgi:hypothetical protein
MSTKNFLKPKKMQTGGMLDLSPKSLNTGASFVSPYVEGLNPRTSNPPSYGIPVTPPAPAPPPPPTITLDNSQIYDPGSFESTLSIHDPGVIAGAAALGHTLTGAENQFTLSDFKANAPPDALSTFFDAAGLLAGKAILTAATGGMAALPLAFVNKATTGSVLGVGKGELADKGRAAATEVFTNVGRALGMSEQPAAAQPATGIVAAAQSAAPAEVATPSIPSTSLGPSAGAVPAYAQGFNTGFGSSVAGPATPAFQTQGTGQFGAITPYSSTVAQAQAQGKLAAEQGKLAVENARGLLAMEEAQAKAAYQATVPTAAAVGTGMFGVAYGLGGEISPSFAIGGKGSYTTFSHYSAGISQADEISMGQAGIASGAYESAADAQNTIGSMITGGHSEATISAAATTGTTTQDITGLAQALGDNVDPGVGGDPPGTPVICTQLFSMGIMSANLYQGEGEHAKNIPNVIRRGYHFWAVPFVRGMRKSQLLFKLGKTLGLSWAQYAAHKANPDKFAPNYFGTVINAIGTPICAAIGLFVGETDWESLWIDYEKGNGLCLDQ